MRRATLAAVGIVVTACFDMTAVSTEPRDAVASIGVVVDAAEGPVLRVSLRADRDENGVVAGFVHDSLVVDGVMHPPLERLPDGVREYAVNLGFGRSVALRLPALASSGAPPELVLPLLYFEFPDTLVAQHGDILEIPLRGVGDRRPESAQQWRFELAADGGHRLTATGSGELPDVLRLLTEPLPDSVSTGNVEVWAVTTFRETLPPYTAIVQRSARAVVPFRLTP